jgi:hypothetical protein
VIAGAASTTQWIIAVGSVGSALVALALGFGLEEWIVRPRVTLLLRPCRCRTRSAIAS